MHAINFTKNDNGLSVVALSDLFTHETRTMLKNRSFDTCILPKFADTQQATATFFYILRFLEDTAIITFADKESFDNLAFVVANDCIFKRTGDNKLLYTRPSLCLFTLTLGDNYRRIVEAGTLSKQAYADVAGYPLEIITEIPADMDIEGRPMSWAKLPLFQRCFQKYNYIFHIDADTVILNDTFTPEMMLVLMHPKQTMLLCHDINGPNCGVILMKKSRELFTLLDRMWACTYCINHCWWENKAFIDLYNNDEGVRDIVHLVPQAHCNLINAYQNNYNRNWLIHFAGVRANLGGQMHKQHSYHRMTVQYDTSMFRQFLEYSRSIHNMSSSSPSSFERQFLRP